MNELNVAIRRSAVKTAKACLRRILDDHLFLDPVSGNMLAPGRFEESLSASVAIYHHAGRIDWGKVPLRSLESGEPTGHWTDRLISNRGILVPEFPLCHTEQQGAEDMKTWGAMKIDLLYFEPETRATGFLDSKLGSKFHYEPSADRVQPARYVDYLLHLNGDRARFFIFATARTLLAEPGYLPVLRAVFEQTAQRRSFAERYAIAWEDVIEARS